MKHLHEKSEQFPAPSRDILDTFLSPRVDHVTLQQSEFTSLCPITGQPDYAVITVSYNPKNLCLESKSFKLYLAAYRNFGGFAETITSLIASDLFAVLQCPLKVKTLFARRGGIDIESVATRNLPSE